MEPTPFAAKAKDLGALRDAVVDAASVGVGLWISYLFALFYFAIAAGAVTHRDLLLESPVKLPFLNVELPVPLAFPPSAQVLLSDKDFSGLFGQLRAVKGQSPYDGYGLITSIRKPAVRAIATLAP